jgi:hypothetical protein
MKRILSILFAITLFSCHRYEVEITYCDGRPKDTITVRDMRAPFSGDIDNSKKAVPEYHMHMNVCDVKTLRKIE